MAPNQTPPGRFDAPHFVADRRPTSYDELELSTETLPDWATRIALEVEEIDECARMGFRYLLKDFNRYFKYLKKHKLNNQLTKTVKYPTLLDCLKREEWIEASLARFRHYLSPCSTTYEAVQESGRTLALTADSKVVLNFDLIVRQKFWGIGFHAKDKELDEAIANHCLSAALGRLKSDIESINKFCGEWNYQRTFLDTVSFSHDRRGNLFEHVILGILNQFEPTIVETSIYDDVHEWSDFRIEREGTLKGVNIQAKFIHHIHDQELTDNHSKASNTIILSPCSIAAFLKESFDRNLYRCSWSELRNFFPVQPDATGDLSSQIYCFFVQLFEGPKNHPLSPIIDVPDPIQLAIYRFVAIKAAEIKARAKWVKSTIESAEVNTGEVNTLRDMAIQTADESI